MVTDSKTSSNTPTRFSEVAATLIAHGYLVIPIRPCEKRPAIDDWPNARLTAADVSRFAPRCGAGVLCGTGKDMPIGVDLDIRHAELARRTRKNFLDLIGCEPPERIGETPKMLFACRIEGPLPKKTTSRAFVEADGKTKSQIELLGKGRQFVVAGIHPDTKKPYEWINAKGKGPLYEHISELPVVTLEQLNELIRLFEEDAIALGLTPMDGSTANAVQPQIEDEDDPFADYVPLNDLTMGEARALLQPLDSSANYDYWIKVGMALHHEFEGSKEALDLWDEWSSTSSKYEDRPDLERHWDSFKNKKAEKVTANWFKKASRDATEAIRRAEKQSVMVDIRALIQACSDPIDLIDVAAPKLGEMTADYPDLVSACESMLSVKSRELNGVKQPISVIRKAMKKGVPVADKADQDLYTDLTNVDLFIDMYGERVRFVEGAKKSKAWLLYNGNYHDVVGPNTIKGLVSDMVRGLPAAPKGRLNELDMGEYQAYVKRSQSAYAINGVVGLLTGEERLRVRAEQLDTHRNILCCKNGPVDLRTSKMIEPNPDMLFTLTTRAEYDPDAKAPLFEKAIADALNNDAQDILLIQMLIGYAACGDPKYQIMPILEGSGGNGKSTIMNALAHALGDYAISVDASTFFSKGRSVSTPGGHRSDLARLNRKRLIIIGEPNSQCEIRTEQIKSLTGNDKIVARGAYAEDEIEFEAMCVPFMITNYPINTNDVDEGTWRRLLRIMLERNLTKEPGFERDLDLPKKLEAEAPGIIALSVKWAGEVLKNGLVIPQKVIEWSQALRREADPIGAFLEQRCVFDTKQSTLCKDLHLAYKSYRHDTGDDTTLPSQNWLTSRLKGRDGLRYSENVKDLTSSRGKGRGFFGIGLLPQEGDFE